MKYELMLQILFLLLAKGKISARYIAQRFDISTRTVMRYLDTMSLANIPIISDTGRNGGFYIADTYKLPANFLTEKEFNAVVSTLTDYNQTIGNKSINSAIDKLLSTKTPNERIVDVKSGNLIIDASSWNGNETIRSIDPHVIILKQGLWYVYAYCNLRNAFRMFKVSRISHATKKEEKFEKRKVEVTSLTGGRWFEKLESEKIELEVSKKIKSEIEEWLGVSNVFPLGGKLVAQTTLPIDEWLVSKILSFGGAVKVISPLRLKEKVLSTAKAVTDMYE